MSEMERFLLIMKFLPDVLWSENYECCNFCYCKKLISRIFLAYIPYLPWNRNSSYLLQITCVNKAYSVERHCWGKIMGLTLANAVSTYIADLEPEPGAWNRK